MIKKHHTHIGLLVVFFTGLIVLWWADVSEVPTESERWQQRTRVVPGLLKVPAEEIHRVEVDNPHGKFVFERRKGHHWQMLQPVDVAADSGLVNRLVTNLKEMRRVTDAGAVKGAPETFGLKPPAATVRVFGSEPQKLLATLDVGTPIALAAGKDAPPELKDRRYVRPVERDGTSEGVEPIDGRLLAVVDSDLAAWRDQTLFDLPTFGITDLTVAGPGRDLVAHRAESHWALVRPVRVPANDDMVEGALAELTSLRVAGGHEGFVADDVRDLAPYGLDKPALTVTLRSRLEPDQPFVLEVGKPVPGKADFYYARRGDQNDVVMIDGKKLRDLGTDPNELRSKKVAELNPAKVTAFEVKAHGREFLVERTATGWVQKEPVRGPADPSSVLDLLSRLGDLQAFEFFEPSQVTDPKLDPPAMSLAVWEAAAPNRADVGPRGDRVLALQIGRHDALRKAVYARIEGDKTILALPDQFLEALPKNEFAFRDRTVLALSPAAITRLDVTRGGRTYELTAPGSSGNPNEWKLLAPVEAPADTESVAQLTMLLSNLRAGTFVTAEPGDGKAFGLDQPSITVAWRTAPEATAGGKAEAGKGTLKLGAAVPRSDEVYATLSGSPLVFTLHAGVVQVFRSEFRSRKVLSFPPGEVSRLVLKWPDRTLSFVPRSGRGGPDTWRPETGLDLQGFDVSRVRSLVDSLGNLKAQEFAQFRGIFPRNFGLDHPHLTVDVVLSGGRGTKQVRIGNRSPEGPLYATTESGSAGEVFTLAGPAWYDLARVTPAALPDLPEDVFMPEVKGGGKGVE